MKRTHDGIGVVGQVLLGHRDDLVLLELAAVRRLGCDNGTVRDRLVRPDYTGRNARHQLAKLLVWHANDGAVHDARVRVDCRVSSTTSRG
jgi:hypothetical protein